MSAEGPDWRVRRRHRRGRIRTVWGTVVSVPLCACLADPESDLPNLPAYPITAVETAELDTQPQSAPMMDGLRRVLRYRPDGNWYADVGRELAQFADAGDILAPIPTLLEALEDGDPAVRRGASFALASLATWSWPRPPAGMASALAAAANDEDPLVRENALAAMSALLPSGPIESELLAALDDPDPRVRWAATRTLLPWRRSQSGLPSLIGLLDDQDLRVRLAAAFNSAFDPEGPALALPGILQRLGDKDPEIRRVAAEQFLYFADALDEATLPYAISLLGDHDTRLRQIAAAMLSSMLFHRSLSEADAAMLAEPLAQALADGDPDVRASAAWALRSLGRAASAATPALTTALEVETNPEARLALRHARHRIAGNSSTIMWSDWPTWSAPELCIDSGEFSLGGLRPWDAEQQVWITLGEPDDILGSWSESDRGFVQMYRYEYPGIQVDIAHDTVEMLTTFSPATRIGNSLRIGMSRQEVLTSEFQIEPPSEALAARRFEIPDCEYPDWGNTVLLDFDESGRLWRVEIFYNSP